MTGPWEFTCPHCGNRANSLHMCGGPSDSGGTGIIPELSASSRLAAAEARIRELDAQVAEARELLTALLPLLDGFYDCDDPSACPWKDDHVVVKKADDWLARTAPKEPEHG